MTDLMTLRSDVVNTKIVKQQRRGLWAEEQSLKARHIYQTKKKKQHQLPCHGKISKLSPTNLKGHQKTHNLELHPGML